MTSARKQEANKRNASHSTGPKTAQGKGRSARNALQHGLSIASLADPSWAPEVRALANALTAPDAPVRLRDRAYEVAAAQIDVMRVGHARHALISRVIADETFETARQRRVRELIIESQRVLPAASYALLMGPSRKLHGDEKIALVLADMVNELLRLDRYERRARSRRRKAIRAFDLMACGASGVPSAARGAAEAFTEPEISS
jgi:hypothetical protein